MLTKRQMLTGTACLLTTTACSGKSDASTAKAAAVSSPSPVADQWIRDLLGREPAAAERSSPTSLQTILSGTEYREKAVDDLYRGLLARSADPSGKTGNVGAIGAGKTNEVIFALVCSPEYFDNRVGGTNRMYITALWRDLLDADVDAEAERALAALERGTSRPDVVRQLLDGERYQAAWRKRVTSQYLGGAPAPAPAVDPSPLTYLTSVLNSEAYRVRAASKPSATPKAFPTWNGAPGPYLTSSGNASFSSSDRVVFTSYFFWYDNQRRAAWMADPDQSGQNKTGKPAFSITPPATPALSYTTNEWHDRQLSDMRDAGIDVALSVTFGSPFSFRTDMTPTEQAANFNSEYSDPGLVALVDTLHKRNGQGPKIGMFYDTSSLNHNNAKGWRVRLGNFAGHRWFYESIRNFFSQVPPEYRACIDGKPVVFVYHPSFAANVSEGCYPYARDKFKADFGSDLYIVTGSEEDAPRITDPHSIKPWVERLATGSYLSALAEVAKTQEFANASAPFKPVDRLHQKIFATPGVTSIHGSVDALLADPNSHRALVADLAKAAWRSSATIHDLLSDPEVIRLGQKVTNGADLLAVHMELLAGDRVFAQAGGTNADLAEYVIQLVMLRSTQPDCGTCATFAIPGDTHAEIMAAMAAGSRPAALQSFSRHPRALDSAASLLLFKYMGRLNPGPYDSSFAWAAAIAPTIRGVYSIGPGYDHRQLPARGPIYVDRKGGNLYRDRWEAINRMSPKPTMVHLESWNELFEGTAICESMDAGRTYIDITRQMTKAYKA